MLAAALASAAPAASAPVRVNCKQKDITVLFWANGHQEIPSVGFPEFLRPHLEVYRTDGDYPIGNLLAVVQADGGFGVAGTSGTLRVWYGTKLGAVATMTPGGSTLSFDRGYCKPYALPQ